MKRIVLFDSIQELRRERKRLEQQYGFTFNKSINIKKINKIPDDSKLKKVLPYPQRDIRDHMNHLIKCTNCFPLFFSNVENPKDAYTLLYSNGLACALLSLSYLYGENIEKVSLCNEWNSKDTRYLSSNIWEESLNALLVQRLENLKFQNSDTLACPYTYLPDFTDKNSKSESELFKVNKLLLPLYQKIVGDIIVPDENGAVRSIKNVFDNHILRLYQQEKNWLIMYEGTDKSTHKDRNIQENLRAHKKRLKEEYCIFYKALWAQLKWENDEKDFGKSIMFRFSKELIYRSEAIVRLEQDLSKMEHINDDEIMNRLTKLNIEGQLPIVFYVDKLKFSEFPPLGAYCDYLKALAISLYEYAGERIDTAYNVAMEIIAKEKNLFPKPDWDANCVEGKPTELPVERQEKHWLITKAAAVCACYGKKNYFDNHSYDTRSYSEFSRTLLDINIATNDSSLKVIKEYCKPQQKRT